MNSGDNFITSCVSEIIVKFRELEDKKVFGEINKYFRDDTDVTEYVLNPTVIKNALMKQIPQKPIFVDTRFRNHGRHISDGVSLCKCYKCPNCSSHIFHVWDDDIYCPCCGQLLDWRENDENN